MIDLRDRIAIDAMSCVYSDLQKQNYELLDFETVAVLAYRLADAMIKARGVKTSGFVGWANLYQTGEIGSIQKDISKVVECAAGDVKAVVEVYISENAVPSVVL